MRDFIQDFLHGKKPERLSGVCGHDAEPQFRKLSDIYDFAPVGYLTLDARGYIREANLTAARFLGVQRPLIINRPFAVFVERSGMRRFLELLRTCRILEKDSAKVPLKIRGGGVVWTEMTSLPVLEEPVLEEGEILLWTVLTDVTVLRKAEEELERHRDRLDELVEERTTEIKKINERLREEVSVHKVAEERTKKLNDELKRNIRRLEEVNRDLEAFNFSLAHDLSAPMRIVDGFARMLAMRYADRLDAEGREFIDTIRKNAQKMIQFTNDILRLSRVGREGVVKTPIDMTVLMREVAAELKDAAGIGRKIIFKFHPLPPATGEKTMIRQVFCNLIANAIKFTGLRETGVIEVGGGAAGNENVYYVKDNGVGFYMARSGRLFSLFGRLHTEAEFEGSGAGLAIVRRIIERHDGRVWAAAKPGEGAAFFFALPARQAGDPA